MELENNDAVWMAEALKVAEKGRLTTPPNPWVGAVLVKEGRFISSGFHVRPGTPHAEIVALKEASEAAEGATLYTTLEPCSHHGRTPPCVDAIIAAGIKKVVIGLTDPDPIVNGEGVKRLKEAGIEVVLGVLKDSIKASLLPYLHHRTHGRPYVVVKVASSLDGRTAEADGYSKWISCEEARLAAHELRAYSQAVLVGAGTARIDKPSLTCRHPEIHLEKQPLRVVLDSKGNLEPEGPLFDPSLAPTLIFTAESTPKSTITSWEDKGVKVIRAPMNEEGTGINLTFVLEKLAHKGVLQLMVEGGATILGSFFNEGKIDELQLDVAPHVIGDTGRPLFAGINTSSLSLPHPFYPVSASLLGTTFKLRFRKNQP